MIAQHRFGARFGNITKTQSNAAQQNFAKPVGSVSEELKYR